MFKINDSIFVINFVEHTCECCGSFLDKEIISKGIIQKISKDYYTILLENNNTYNTPNIYNTIEEAEEDIRND